MCGALCSMCIMEIRLKLTKKWWPVHSLPGSWWQLMLPKQFHGPWNCVPFSLNWPRRFDAAAIMAATFFRGIDVSGPPQTLCIDQNTHLISLHCFLFYPDSENLYWLTFEGKRNGSMCEEMLRSSRTNVPQQTEKENLFCYVLPPVCSGLRDPCLVPWGFQQPPDDIFNIIASPGSGLFIWCLHLENREKGAG